MKSLRFLSIIIAAMLYSCTSNDIDNMDGYEDPDSGNSSSSSSSSGSGDGDGEYTDVNEWSDAIMLKEYLYNEEYATMTRDFSLDYDDFIYNTLWSMTTNVLDQKYTKDDYYDFSEIFTYITQSYTGRASYDSSKYSIGYGSYYTKILSSVIRNQIVYFVLFSGIYPDSPLDKEGITRSNLFYLVNGSSITSSNKDSISALIDSPAVGDELTLVDYFTREEYTITADYVYLNPVTECRAITLSDNTKVGYLNFNRFDSNFDSELKAALATLHDEQVTEFILDLRCNLGGDVSTANILTSCIASITASSTPLLYYRYNDDLTSIYKNSYYLGKYDTNSGYFAEYPYTSLSPTSSHLDNLSNKRIYCLTTINTVSASELVINLLRGLDYEVITIGSTSRGKNVGSWTETTTIGDYTYDFHPITTQIYNALYESDYASGFTPDAENIIYEDFSIPFADYGIGESLFDRAAELITGISSTSASSASIIESRTGTTLALTPIESQPTALAPSPHLPHGAIVNRPQEE